MHHIVGVLRLNFSVFGLLFHQIILASFSMSWFGLLQNKKINTINEIVISNLATLYHMHFLLKQYISNITTTLFLKKTLPYMCNFDCDEFKSQTSSTRPYNTRTMKVIINAQNNMCVQTN